MPRFAKNSIWAVVAHLGELERVAEVDRAAKVAAKKTTERMARKEERRALRNAKAPKPRRESEPSTSDEEAEG